MVHLLDLPILVEQYSDFLCREVLITNGLG
jgi:hypothetical protein